MADGATQHDEQLARSILNAAQQIGARLFGKWVGGATLMDAARDAAGKGFDSDDHATRLIDGVLIANDLLEEEMNPNGETKILRRRRFRITQVGWKLLMGRSDVPPVPGVYDPRLDSEG